MGKKSPTRKPPRRKRAPTPVPADLIELAGVLNENARDDNFYGWLSIPWRDGWNAAMFAYDFHLRTPAVNDPWLSILLHNRRTQPPTYWEIEDILPTVNEHFRRAAYRCAQLMIAKSDGGGVVANDVLRRAFEALEISGRSAKTVMAEYRCRDAIGTTSVLQNDINDRARRAFTIAWNRGLYQAAYALPQAMIWQSTAAHISDFAIAVRK